MNGASAGNRVKSGTAGGKSGTECQKSGTERQKSGTLLKRTGGTKTGDS
jgi:hypothetical protein